MGLCPKCNAALEGELTVCPKCGAALPLVEAEKGSDTLDVFAHGDMSADAPSDTPADTPADAQAPIAQAPISSNSDNEATHVDPAASFDLSMELGPGVEIDPPTSDTLNAELGLTPEPNLIEATQREIVEEGQDFGTAETAHLSASDFPEADSDPLATIDSDSMPAQGDDVGTVVNVQDKSGSSRGTAVYSESELRDALEGRTSGTDGKLKRLWDVAAGSSDNPLHTLRGEEALASDSLFKRVAVRRLVPANAPSDEQADYVIVDKVGQGGMGIVYSARQTNVNRMVALKAILAKLQDSDENRRKFFYEAQITADLDHPTSFPFMNWVLRKMGCCFMP